MEKTTVRTEEGKLVTGEEISVQRNYGISDVLLGAVTGGLGLLGLPSDTVTVKTENGDIVTGRRS